MGRSLNDPKTDCCLSLSAYKAARPFAAVHFTQEFSVALYDFVHHATFSQVHLIEVLLNFQALYGGAPPTIASLQSSNQRAPPTAHLSIGDGHVRGPTTFHHLPAPLPLAMFRSGGLTVEQNALSKPARPLKTSTRPRPRKTQEPHSMPLRP